MYKISVVEYWEEGGTDPEDYVLEKLLAGPKGPERSYLLQCANWLESECESGLWVAFSHIEARTSPYWSLYDISLEFSDHNKIEFSSWKGDYEPFTIDYAPSGNLNNPEQPVCFSGQIWTRGE
jgi:hypothetical protein